VASIGLRFRLVIPKCKPLLLARFNPALFCSFPLTLLLRSVIFRGQGAVPNLQHDPQGAAPGLGVAAFEPAALDRL
jgi:hypothetical protein